MDKNYDNSTTALPRGATKITSPKRKYGVVAQSKATKEGKSFASYSVHGHALSLQKPNFDLSTTPVEFTPQEEAELQAVLLELKEVGSDIEHTIASINNLFESALALSGSSHVQGDH